MAVVISSCEMRYIKHIEQPLAHSQCLTEISCYYSPEVTHFHQVDHDE